MCVINSDYGKRQNDRMLSFLSDRSEWTTHCDESWQLLLGDVLNLLPLTERDADLSGLPKCRRKPVDLTIRFGQE